MQNVLTPFWLGGKWPLVSILHYDKDLYRDPPASIMGYTKKWLIHFLHWYSEPEWRCSGGFYFIPKEQKSLSSSKCIKACRGIDSFFRKEQGNCFRRNALLIWTPKRSRVVIAGSEDMDCKDSELLTSTEVFFFLLRLSSSSEVRLQKAAHWLNYLDSGFTQELWFRNGGCLQC